VRRAAAAFGDDTRNTCQHVPQRRPRPRVSRAHRLPRRARARIRRVERLSQSCQSARRR
jgi:hypothetical protein